jgi:oligopeptide transport system permease protein
VLRYVLGRLAIIVPVTFAVLSLTFFLVQLAPGSPFATRKTTVESRARLNAKYGLDQPKRIQYVRYLARLAGFSVNPTTLRYTWRPYPDFGESLAYQGRSVNQIVLSGLPVSAFLGLTSYALALIVGCLLGILAAVQPDSWLDWVITTAGAMGVAVPSFILGPVMVMLFSLNLNWFPPARLDWMLDWGFVRIPTLRTMTLPVLTLALAYVGYISRLVRGSLLEILAQDFIQTARAKGLPESTVILKHALRGALVPVVSFSGFAIADLITGAVVVESVFSVPGLGHYFVDAAASRDYFLILGLTAFATIAVMLSTLFTDCIYTWVDPRIRYS